LHLEYRYISGRETQGLYATVLLARPEWLISSRRADAK